MTSPFQFPHTILYKVMMMIRIAIVLSCHKDSCLRSEMSQIYSKQEQQRDIETRKRSELVDIRNGRGKKGFRGEELIANNP